MYKAVIGKSSMPSNGECGILVIVEIDKSEFVEVFHFKNIGLRNKMN